MAGFFKNNNDFDIDEFGSEVIGDKQLSFA
jgi:hypothetical protein